VSSARHGRAALPEGRGGQHVPRACGERAAGAAGAGGARAPARRRRRPAGGGAPRGGPSPATVRRQGRPRVGLGADGAPRKPARRRGVSDLVAITGIAAGGDGVGRLPEGRAVFVSRTAPGDRVRGRGTNTARDRKSTRLNSSHV